MNILGGGRTAGRARASGCLGGAEGDAQGRAAGAAGARHWATWRTCLGSSSQAARPSASAASRTNSRPLALCSQVCSRTPPRAHQYSKLLT